VLAIQVYVRLKLMTGMARGDLPRLTLSNSSRLRSSAASGVDDMAA
jgi:hypothetical protein